MDRYSSNGNINQQLFYYQNANLSVYALGDINGNLVEGYQYDEYGQQTVFPQLGGGVSWGPDNAIPGGNSLVGNPFTDNGALFDPDLGGFESGGQVFSPELGRDLNGPIGDDGDGEFPGIGGLAGLGGGPGSGLGGGPGSGLGGGPGSGLGGGPGSGLGGGPGSHSGTIGGGGGGGGDFEGGFGGNNPAADDGPDGGGNDGGGGDTGGTSETQQSDITFSDDEGSTCQNNGDGTVTVEDGDGYTGAPDDPVESEGSPIDAVSTVTDFVTGVEVLWDITGPAVEKGVDKAAERVGEKIADGILHLAEDLLSGDKGGGGPKNNEMPTPDGGGGGPASMDGGGRSRTSPFGMPSPDGGGAGPASLARLRSRYAMPNPEGGGPVGPAGRLAMPTPEGGGPVGPAGMLGSLRNFSLGR